MARVDCELLRYGSRGGRYRVTMGGAVLAESTGDPLCAAARALAERGLSGIICMGPAGKPWTIRGDIGRLSGLTLSETDAHGLRYNRYRPDAFAWVEGVDESATMG